MGLYPLKYMCSKTCIPATIQAIKTKCGWFIDEGLGQQQLQIAPSESYRSEFMASRIFRRMVLLWKIVSQNMRSSRLLVWNGI